MSLETLETHLEEAEDWTPQLTGKTNMTTATTTTSTLSRADMVTAIKLRDPTFVDSTAYSDAYLSGRYSGSIAMQPVVGIPKSSDLAQPATKLDETELSPVTKAQIAAENERDRARAAVSSLTTTKRTDADEADLSPVTKAQIAAHNRDEAQRRGGGFGGGSGDAA